MAKDTSGRRLQSYMSKMSTRYIARLPIVPFPEFPLVGSVNDAVHAAIARFGQLTSFVEWAFSVPTRLRAPVPLTLPSPPKLCRHLCRLVSNDRDRLTASERDF